MFKSAKQLCQWMAYYAADSINGIPTSLLIIVLPRWPVDAAKETAGSGTLGAGASDFQFWRSEAAFESGPVNGMLPGNRCCMGNQPACKGLYIPDEQFQAPNHCFARQQRLHFSKVRKNSKCTHNLKEHCESIASTQAKSLSKYIEFERKWAAMSNCRMTNG